MRMLYNEYCIHKPALFKKKIDNGLTLSLAKRVTIAAPLFSASLATALPMPLLPPVTCTRGAGARSIVTKQSSDILLTRTCFPDMSYFLFERANVNSAVSSTRNITTKTSSNHRDIRRPFVLSRTQTSVLVKKSTLTMLCP